MVYILIIRIIQYYCKYTAIKPKKTKSTYMVTRLLSNKRKEVKEEKLNIKAGRIKDIALKTRISAKNSGQILSGYSLGILKEI